jgi:hypothetical protein
MVFQLILGFQVSAIEGKEGSMLVKFTTKHFHLLMIQVVIVHGFSRIETQQQDELIFN